MTSESSMSNGMRGAFCGLLTAAALAVSSCAYQTGSLMHPQLRSVHIAPPAAEDTRYATLARDFRRALHEQMMRDGSLQIAPKEKADATIETRLAGTSFARSAAARLRTEDDELDEDRDAYQTTVFQAEAQVEVRLIMPLRERPVLDWTPVTGTAEFFRMPDMAEARRYGLKKAANDAAQKAVRAVTEAW